MSERRLAVRVERWPLAGAFTISRGSKTEARVAVAEITQGAAVGRGECVPYARYGETIEGVVAAIEGLAGAVADGLDGDRLQTTLPAGAARNAVDCALWDLEAKITGTPVWQRAGLAAPAPLTTAYTLSLDTPQAMASAARENGHRPLLKVKLGRDGVVERVHAIREAAPAAALIVDANEAWTPALLGEVAPVLAESGVAMIEQPLPAGEDEALAGIERPVPVCADESCHDSATLAGLAGRYDLVNVKLDKTGGLTEALRLARAAEAAGFGVMVGCMIATSLAMAPATLVAARARFVDLDGPLILARDREPGIIYRGSTMEPPPRELWG
ncbi:MAG: N-acetyl-D-Glu racemase DgcA [Alphaproteobacteria bacterium]